MTDASPDTFAAVTALIALISDPKAAKARLEELAKQIAAAEKAHAALTADRAEHTRTVAADKAEGRRAPDEAL
jgi:chorismate mutase